MSDDQDPPEAERTWMRHVQTNELGYLVKRSGAEYVKYNRESEDIAVPYKPGEWVPDVDRRPLTGAQVAQIAHAADRELCKSLGMHKEAKLEWQSIRDTQRAAMIEGKPPGKPAIRAKVWTAIWDELKDFCR
jgi:hypothetical protein